MNLYKVLITIFIASCTLLLNGCSRKEEQVLKSGDLLFVGTSGSDLGNAITEVTENDKAQNYSHIAMVFKMGDSLFVIDATPKYGVSVRPIEQFIKEESSNNIVIDLYRTGLSHEQINEAIKTITPFIGRPYNHAYLQTDSAFYCSQLIHDAFAEYKVFNMEPMTFKSDGETLPFWLEYYEKLGAQIPEGVLGCNPNGMAADDDISFIGKMDQL